MKYRNQIEGREEEERKKNKKGGGNEREAMVNLEELEI